ncbi:hypothetical protein HDE_11669 [Halotydeus destructor]|nr:hypothetical protein HDE_11669 [Halotydeus destructor]
MEVDSDVDVVGEYLELESKAIKEVEEIRPDNINVPAKNLSGILHQTDGLAETSKQSKEISVMLYDSSVLCKSAFGSTKFSQVMVTDTRAFDVIDFANHLEELVDEEERFGTGRFEALGLKYRKLIATIDASHIKPNHSEYGEAIKPKAKKGEKSKKPPQNGASGSQETAPKKTKPAFVIGEKTKATVVSTTEAAQQAGTDETTLAVEAMNTSLGDLVSENQNRPVPVLELVTDQRSYTKTVENVFHLMFLVKEGVVKLLHHNGSLLISPVDPEGSENGAGDDVQDNVQDIIQLTKADWERGCQILRSKKR